MLPEDWFFRSGDDSRIWQRYCGFLDLSLKEYMETQEALLMEEIDLVADTPLGKKIMMGKRPRSVAEFRRVVPITTYEDYEPYLKERREDVLAEKPYFWVHTSGRGGDFKWIPYTRAAFDVVARYVIGGCILGSAAEKGQINFRPGNRLLFTMAPPPYASGSLFYYLSQYISLQTMPPIEDMERMEFQQAIQRAFELGLRSGVDSVAAISSVLVKMGERMAGESGKIKPTFSMLHPGVLFRLLRALLRARMENRHLLPRDLWPTRAIMTGGADAAIYKDAIARYWGQVPYEVYASTEVLLLAMQNWNRKWMTFLPQSAFWEFMPEDEWLKSYEDKGHRPSTVLFNELEEGKVYEVVLSHFYGMPLLRYRIGDLIKVAALRDEETGVNLPQIVFKSRADGLIDLAGMTKLDEKTVWQAIANTGIKYEDWSARKEYHGSQAYLHLYIELKEKGMNGTGEVEHLVDAQLKVVDVDYRDLDTLLGIQPVKATILSQGTFERYYQEKVQQGAHLAHLKPPHMNAPDAIISRLLHLSAQE